ncbi:MAG: YdeI/OmpD-associated family protein, partial [Gemmatimonadota bacterium]
VIMQPFKAHLSLMFFKGALLDDPADILSPVGETTRAARRIEFTSREQVAERSAVIAAYVREAVAAEEKGLKVPEKEVAQFDVPAELERRLEEDEAYREAFEALTPGRKKSYLIHFSGAKRAETRVRRIDTCRPKVLQGKGFNER